MATQFKTPITAKVRALFTQLELELQEAKPDIHLLQTWERQIAAHIKEMIDDKAKKVVAEQLTTMAGR